MTPMTLPNSWVDDFMTFWFTETKPEQWFAKSDAFDAEMRRRFLKLHEAVSVQPTEALSANGRTAMAAILVLDQMSRNMFRGSPRAFGQDAKALAIAEAVVARGLDQGMTKDERTFCYLPFEHAEHPEAQAKCVELMGSLGDPDLVKWAQAHKVIVDRFGRFPHRNEVLGRNSTAEEVDFLKQPGSSF
jgi:uncharacterized protein (DUF924 family)